MRVAIVVERFEAGAGGVENVAWRAAHGLAAAGDEVHVICRVAGGSPTRAVQVHALRIGRTWQPLRVARFDRCSRRELERGAFDVVHSMTRTRRQDIYRAGGGSHADYMQRRYSGAGRRLRRISPRHALLLSIERRVFGDASQIIHCNSEMVAGEIHARFGVPTDRLVVVYNGVDLERYRPRDPDEPSVLREELAGPGPVWVFAGSGFPRKGLDTALRALAASEAPDARLWVLGRDAAAPWKRLARQLGVGERVQFLGFRSDAEAVYRAADGLLLPTRYDAFASACLEAAATGIPVVTSGANGAGELIERSAGGIVVRDPEDVQGFARALDKLADAGLRRELGENGRRLAETCSWEDHVKALRELHARALRARGRGRSG